MHDVDDPRAWPAGAPPVASRLHALARASLDAATRQEGDRADAALHAALFALLRDGDGEALATAFATAPGGDVYRHLWRMLAEAEAAPASDGVQATLFALPLVVVAGVADPTDAPPTLPGVLPDPKALAALLREHGAVGGNRTFTLAPALAAADALEFARLPRLLAPRILADAATDAARAALDVAPAPIALPAGHESVHLRFVVGMALAAPGVDLLGARDAGKWGIPFAQAIGVQLAVPGASVLALPHPPQRLVPALQTGRALQREVSAQVS